MSEPRGRLAQCSVSLRAVLAASLGAHRKAQHARVYFVGGRCLGAGEFPNGNSSMPNGAWRRPTPASSARPAHRAAASSGGKRGVQRRPWHSGGGPLTPGLARARRHTPWEKGGKVCICDVLYSLSYSRKASRRAFGEPWVLLTLKHRSIPTSSYLPTSDR